MEDVVNMISEIDLKGTSNENKASIAYSLSKQTIIDEMEEFDKYNILKRTEFLEFIGRLAFLIYPDAKLSLAKKIEMLLRQLLKTVVNKAIVIPDLNEGAESESDYEDDVVDKIL